LYPLSQGLLIATQYANRLKLHKMPGEYAMKNIFSPSSTRRLAVILLLCLWSAIAEAKTPWHWQMSLRTDSVVGAALMPTTLYVDADKERYYLIDSGNNRLLSFSREGKLLHSFTADNELKIPFDMVRTESNDLWVVEKGRNTLTQINTQEKKTTPHTIEHNGRLVFPDRVEYTKNRFYILDKASGDILVLDINLTILRRVACPTEKGAGGFVDFKVVNDDIWALDRRSKTVYHFNGDGVIADRIHLGDEVLSPVSLAIDANEVIYILDRLAGTVAAFDRSGKNKYLFLESGQAQGQLYFPNEILFDPWGQLCIVDEGNGRVEIFSR